MKVINQHHKTGKIMLEIKTLKDIIAIQDELNKTDPKGETNVNMEFLTPDSNGVLYTAVIFYCSLLNTWGHAPKSGSIVYHTVGNGDGTYDVYKQYINQ